MANTDIEEIIENFELLDDWDDRYRYLMELGQTLDPFPSEAQTQQNKVQGCVSQVWVTSSMENSDDPTLYFVGDSDAHIVKGLIAIAFAIFSGKSASQIMNTDEQKIFQRIDLSEHITPQRSNGLSALIQRIKKDANQALTA